MTSQQRTLISAFLRDEIRHSPATTDAAEILYNAVRRANVEPSLEETKDILVEVLRKLKAAMSTTSV